MKIFYFIFLIFPTCTLGQPFTQAELETEVWEGEYESNSRACTDEPIVITKDSITLGPNYYQVCRAFSFRVVNEDSDLLSLVLVQPGCVAHRQIFTFQKLADNHYHDNLFKSTQEYEQRDLQRYFHCAYRKNEDN